MKVALDTNILAYAEGVNGAEKRDEALTFLRRLPEHAALVGAQALGELFNLLVLKRSVRETPRVRQFSRGGTRTRLARRPPR